MMLKSLIGYELSGKKCETVTHCVEGKGKLVDGKCKCTDRWSGLFCQLRTCYNGVSVGTGVGFKFARIFQRTFFFSISLPSLLFATLSYSKYLHK